MKEKILAHPLIFALYPVLFVLLNTANNRHLSEPLRNGICMALGGVVLYVVIWVLLRILQRGQAQQTVHLRAALLASLVLLMFHAYDPVYELVRGRELLGLVVGKHRFLLPVWLALSAFSAGWLYNKFTRARLLNGIFTTGSLVILVASLAVIAATGSWRTSLRDIGLVPPPGLEVSYINVGDLGPNQPGVIGDAILLRSTEGKTVLIDGGYPNGLAAAYLARQGVTHLDMIVMTHPHDDHSGGLIEVLKTIPVDLFVSNGEPLPDSPVYWELQDAIQAAGVPTQIVRAGDELPFGYLTFQVLSPSMISPNSVNHNSVVLRLVVGKVGFLFTGDTDSVEQMRLMDIGANVQAKIYKLAHHGAEGNNHPGFIARVDPDVAIYMAGAGNAYGFPEPGTLRMLQSAGITVYGTDQNGSIIVKTDGKTYQVIPEREGQQ
jgi:beta-lactamase superfamily II metal-dependent hydrolase